MLQTCPGLQVLFSRCQKIIHSFKRKIKLVPANTEHEYECVTYLPTVGFFLRFFFFFWPFPGFIDRKAEECDRKQGKRRGVTRSQGTRAGSRTRLRCRASAHGSRTLPTEVKRHHTQCGFLRFLSSLHFI